MGLALGSGVVFRLLEGAFSLHFVDCMPRKTERVGKS